METNGMIYTVTRHNLSAEQVEADSMSINPAGALTFWLERQHDHDLLVYARAAGFWVAVEVSDDE
jgi:hypothetical protein